MRVDYRDLPNIICIGTTCSANSLSGVFSTDLFNCFQALNNLRIHRKQIVMQAAFADWQERH